MSGIIRILALLQTVFFLSLSAGFAGEQMSNLEYIKTKDATVRGVLQANADAGHLEADKDTRQVAADWLRKVVRPDWLPENLAEVLKPQRSRFDFSPPNKVDVFRWHRVFGDGTLTAFEGVGIILIWSSPSIVIGTEPEKQARILLQAVLRDYSGIGVIRFSEQINKSSIIQGNMSINVVSDFPTSWSDAIDFWITDGIFIVKTMQVTPESSKKAAFEAAASTGDRLRFNDITQQSERDEEEKNRH
jgi:hypothetical protein